MKNPITPFDKSQIRMVIIAGVLSVLMASHWLTSTDTEMLHAVHMFFRKLFFFPVILAALWFGLRGSLITCTLITILYLPYIFIAWHGNYYENIAQLAEVIMVWGSGILFGFLALREKEHQENLIHVHEGAVIALVKALDAREHDTQLHSLRVQAYALKLGHELEMSEDELFALGQGALLHDIGKIGIPDNVLLKEGPLNDFEWEMMRDHPRIGRDMLTHANFLSSATDIVYSHHENFDGSGYPQGLKGTQISLGARVFSIVDAFDALTSKRPYQDEVKFSEAVNRLKRSSGTQFDPMVMKKFLDISEGQWRTIAESIDFAQ